MQARSLCAFILSSLLALVTASPSVHAQSLGPPGPAPATHDLGPGEKVTDSEGRTVENTGTNGVIKVTHTGTWTGTGQNIEVSGSISVVEQPSTGGSKGVKVNTNNKPTQIDLKKNGNSSEHNTVEVTGGNATINVTGKYTDYSVGGTGNTVTVSNPAGGTCTNCTGTGLPNSGGTYRNNTPMGANNTFNGPVTWTIL